MVKLWAMSALILLTSTAFAGPNIVCRGKTKFESLRIDLYGGLTSGSAVVFVNDREISRFPEIEISYVFRTFEGENNHGDSFKGKLTDFTQKSAVLYNLKVPGYGVKISNLSISCK